MKKFNPARFFDEFALAGRGLLLATRKKNFWIAFAVTFVVFGTLINLLSSGFTSFQLIGSCLSGGDFAGALKIIGNAFLAIFGVGRDFLDFALNFALTLLQSVLVALVVFVFKHKRKNLPPSLPVSPCSVLAVQLAAPRFLLLFLALSFPAPPVPLSSPARSASSSTSARFCSQF